MGQKQFFSDTHGTSGSGTSMESVEGKGLAVVVPGVVMTAPWESTTRNVLRRRAEKAVAAAGFMYLYVYIYIYIYAYTYVISAARSRFFLHQESTQVPLWFSLYVSMPLRTLQWMCFWPKGQRCPLDILTETMALPFMNCFWSRDG